MCLDLNIIQKGRLVFNFIESNEWLTGRFGGELEDDYIFDQEDGSTYQDVYNAFGVKETLYRSRSQLRVKYANNKSSRSSSRHLIDVIEDEDIQYENEEEVIDVQGSFEKS